jgi:hypothetical protein
MQVSSGALQGLALLSAKMPLATRSVNATQTGAAALPPVSPVLSGRTFEALQEIQRILGSTTAARHAPTPVEGTSGPREAIDWSRVPGDVRSSLEGTGAASWRIRQYPAMDDAELTRRVTETMIENGARRLAGFEEALANGTLRIEPAANRPDLGYRSTMVDLYNGAGEHIGGAGFTTFDSTAALELRRAGIYASGGSIAGNDYVVSWPMAWDADNAWLGTLK